MSPNIIGFSQQPFHIGIILLCFMDLLKDFVGLRHQCMVCHCAFTTFH